MFLATKMVAALCLHCLAVPAGSNQSRAPRGDMAGRP
jgi:hypothetical protein